MYLVDNILSVILAGRLQQARQLEQPPCLGEESGEPQQFHNLWVCDRDGR